MEPLKIFVSSVMRTAIEDLSEERSVMCEAVEAFEGVARAWAFEKEPASTKPLRNSYVDEVKACDFLLLIVGRVVTPAVREEFETALDHGKPILAFVKNVTDREPEAIEVIRLLDAKYDTFTIAADLASKVRAALSQEILRRARGNGPAPSHESGDLAESLRALSRTRKPIRVTPLIPPCEYDVFAVTDLKSGLLTLHKQSTDEDVAVPLSRVAELLPEAHDREPTLIVNGRVQWLTLPSRWRFFREVPDSTDPLRLGVGRATGRDDPFIVGLNRLLAPKGQHVTWSLPPNVPARLANKTHEVFYDDEGRYLVSSGAILMIARRA
jgi:hypothetical protein